MTAIHWLGGEYLAIIEWEETEEDVKNYVDRGGGYHIFCIVLIFLLLYCISNYKLCPRIGMGFPLS